MDLPNLDAYDNYCTERQYWNSIRGIRRWVDARVGQVPAESSSVELESNPLNYVDPLGR